MGFLSRLYDSVVGGLAGFQVGARSIEAATDRELVGSDTPFPEADKLHEGATKAIESAFAEMELALDDVGWKSLQNYGRWDFTRPTIRKLSALSRVMFLMNPLIRRAVAIQELYVWGRGVKIESENPAISEVLDDFFKAKKNQMVVGASWNEREREQRIDGNTFFVFFVNKVTGACRVRLIPMEEVEDIICNPEDSKEPWYYIRNMPSDDNRDLHPSVGGYAPSQRRLLYPDIGYNPLVKPSLSREGDRIEWDSPVLHIKTGALSAMKFGLPELFSALSWATGYKKFLEGFATLIAAYARVAMKISGLGGKNKVAATKSKMQTGINSGNLKETNPSTTTASWFLASGNADIQPVRTAGSTTGPDEARALRCMVASGSDLPEHFFGDSSVGNFATSTTLDRPTELKMIDRQQFWSIYIREICFKLIEWSARAPLGKLRSAGFKVVDIVDQFDSSPTVIITPPSGQELHLNVEFPNILERDVTDRVRSVVMAATLGGSKAEGIFPDRKLVASLLLEALGEKDSQHILDVMYPTSVMQGFMDPADAAKNEELAAQGKADLGQAAIISANASKTTAEKPTPKPAAQAAIK